MGGSDLSAATIHHHLNHVMENVEDEYVLKAAQLVKIRMYIDDLILALENLEEAIKLRKTSQIYLETWE